MSRIGFSPIKIPEKVRVSIEGAMLCFECGSDKESYSLPDEFSCDLKDDSMYLKIVSNTEELGSQLGLHRAMINNIIHGMAFGFQKELVIEGVGYTAAVQDKYLIVNIGYSHAIFYAIPLKLNVSVVKNNIVLKSTDKMLLGAVVVDICSFRKFDPYKGKGIFVKDSFMLRKQAKKK